MLGQAKSRRQYKADAGAKEWSSEESAVPWSFLEQLAREICARRLRLPALIALEAGRPLAFVGGQLLWISQPVLGLLLPSNVIGQTARLLENPEAVTALIENLEARA